MEATVQLDVIVPELMQIIGGIRTEQLDEPTPCAGFTVRNVLEHMIGGAQGFAAAFRGEDGPAGPAPAPEASADELRAAFAAAIDEFGAAAQLPGVLDRVVSLPFGEMTGGEVLKYVALDGLIHSWDLSTATGRPFDPPADVVTAVDAYARTAITPALRQPGLFDPPVAPPAGASDLVGLVAFTGRRP
jgi:uncharacterized protein (TIGR03086 family)